MRIDQSWYVKPPGIAEHTSCGGVVVRKVGDRILVALVTEPGFKEYILPKGHVESGENLEQAARREIAEEAGFTELKLVKSLGSIGRLDFRKRSWGTMHYFLFTTSQEETSPSDPEHQYIVKWFPIDALPEMFWPEQGALIEDNTDMIRKIFE
ncbi:MAG: ADP-ribose pyrophosphatase [Candidatus Edwardsbacteria bacterium RIFOXYD12_FULL_50_11]|uniref:ADP-ribose pyrophosphatase n=1 Tax=Candidatus Edwardsbacteria bacterium GWF2_54_11 TaxID=1817851 RepID=A0A1F5R825_9BACT|nr:MAG: ADP-ribose pyrophosphatase [Candidatus Edwardsbacteria bacterium RifOxyC12_full_54_24]OGF07746.1 MAG: ADP-ribose pyrophosphatase [Candidatus Edwardsbacteria bacterium RifOxyA12_full_54_48]OGF09996.1 MAG: ADP-ribose pyrophosphatase [Candidatus Edwardsbacteria bacterium GWE2_54_12]OGF10535.1 MAG: ADP-ribose pyrophosphatase [Candidatus Edwardsbacteria bacterium GWF2_54_11]OGF14906.1 MAG: ADP-ribose pyrophosphatase [Candidatus Edwardsbacteria bacterium RIFOXYD12_FULL_50_11]OGJ19315.1 MAG: 